MEKAQRILERKDPAYRAWRDEERKREREKDLRRQGEAPAAAMASRCDDALRRCAIMPAGVPHAASAPIVNGRCFPDVSADAAAFGAPSRRRDGGTDHCWEETHLVAGGLAGLSFPGRGIHTG